MSGSGYGVFTKGASGANLASELELGQSKSKDDLLGSVAERSAARTPKAGEPWSNLNQASQSGTISKSVGDLNENASGVLRRARTSFAITLYSFLSFFLRLCP